MPVLRYENLTHVELSALPKEKTVMFIPTGPLEQHGPHLPLGTDPLSAAFFSEKLAERMATAKTDWNFVLFPPLFAGSDTLTYTGTIEVRPAILRALLLDCCKHLAKDGFKNIVLFGTHGGPRHMVVLEEVASKVRWRYKARAISASGRMLYDILQGEFIQKIASRLEKSGQPLSPDELKGLEQDYHGGLLETSVMLAARPELVKESYKTLEPALVKSYFQLRRSSGKKVGAGLGHLGSPALARAEIGHAAIEVFIEGIAPLIDRFLNGENVYREFRSKFYYVPFFRTDFKFVVLLMLYPLLLLAGWLVANRMVLEVMQ